MLGWASVRGEVSADALLLCLIVFLWTPPHFWALALYRVDDYRRAGLPTLPVTHGGEFTRLQILLYTVALLAATVLPFATGMSGLAYLAAAIVLGGLFIPHAWKLWRRYSDAQARATFRFSIVYLSLSSERCWSTTVYRRSAGHETGSVPSMPQPPRPRWRRS